MPIDKTAVAMYVYMYVQSMTKNCSIRAVLIYAVETW